MIDDEEASSVASYIAISKQTNNPNNPLSRLKLFKK